MQPTWRWYWEGILVRILRVLDFILPPQGAQVILDPDDHIIIHRRSRFGLFCERKRLRIAIWVGDHANICRLWLACWQLGGHHNTVTAPNQPACINWHIAEECRVCKGETQHG